MYKFIRTSEIGINPYELVTGDIISENLVYKRDSEVGHEEDKQIISWQYVSSTKKKMIIKCVGLQTGSIYTFYRMCSNTISIWNYRLVVVGKFDGNKDEIFRNYRLGVMLYDTMYHLIGSYSYVNNYIQKVGLQNVVYDYENDTPIDVSITRSDYDKAVHKRKLEIAPKLERLSSIKNRDKMIYIKFIGNYTANGIINKIKTNDYDYLLREGIDKKFELIMEEFEKHCN
jgi:hypothetical protein